LVELLGRGGMSEVWRAHDTDTDRMVAIKILPAHFSDNEDFKQRFRREAQAAARLNTPHVLPIHHYGEIDGRLYVDMRLIEGRDLQAVLADGPLEPARAVGIIDGVAKALHAAHGVGGLSRGTRVGLIAGAVALVAVIAAAGMTQTACVRRGPGSRPTSSSAPTSSERSYAAQVVLPFTGLRGPEGVAVDSVGNLYVTDWGNNRVLKLAAGSSAQDVLPFTGLRGPQGLAVDSVGTLYVTDGNEVLKLPAGASTQEVLPFIGLSDPKGVAVDSASTLYVADYYNDRVVKLPAGSATQEVLPFTGLHHPVGVAVDSAGNLYVADYIKRVVKLPTGSATQVMLPFTGPDSPVGVAVDSASNLYVTNYDNSRVLKLPAGSASQKVLPFTDLTFPWGVAVDSAGNLYVVSHSDDQVVKLPVQ
jgi:serine/threonine-protein kinase